MAETFPMTSASNALELNNVLAQKNATLKGTRNQTDLRIIPEVHNVCYGRQSTDKARTNMCDVTTDFTTHQSSTNVEYKLLVE